MNKPQQCARASLLPADNVRSAWISYSSVPKIVNDGYRILVTPVTCCVAPANSPSDAVRDKHHTVKKIVFALEFHSNSAEQKPNTSLCELLPDDRVLSVGRAAQCDFRVKDAFVSGKHCCIFLSHHGEKPRDERLIPRLQQEHVDDPNWDVPKRVLDSEDSGVSIYLMDHSSNGTFVNGRKVLRGVPQRLSPYDVVTLYRRSSSDAGQCDQLNDCAVAFRVTVAPHTDNTGTQRQRTSGPCMVSSSRLAFRQRTASRGSIGGLLVVFYKKSSFCKPFVLSDIFDLFPLFLSLSVSLFYNVIRGW